MQTQRPLQLALSFDHVHLEHEVARFAPSEWQDTDRPNGKLLRLVAVTGDPADPDARGPMRATPHLDRCPGIRRLLAQLRAPLGRAFLWRPETGAGKPRSGPAAEARDHALVHAIVSGRSRVQVGPDADPVDLAAGEIWLLPSAHTSDTGTRTQEPATHLVIETVGSAQFWRLADVNQPSRHIDPASLPDAPLAFERVNYPVVMTPWELEHHIAHIAFALNNSADAADRDALLTPCETLVQDWRALWACLGDSDEAMPAYRGLLAGLTDAIAGLAGRMRLDDGGDPVTALHESVIASAINPELRPPRATDPGTEARTAPERASGHRVNPRFERPVFIVAAPRSGSSLLFETLANSPTVWTVGGESHAEFEGIAALHPINRGWDSNRLNAHEATPEVAMRLQAAFQARLKNRDGKRLPDDSTAFRLLEKTPKNALRIPFLARLFPDARFIYLYREPRGNIGSIIEAWRSHRFVTYPQLPGWQGSPWSLVLIPGWRELIGAPIERIAAAQWRGINETVLADLAQLPDASWRAISYEEFTSDPQGSAERLTRFANIDWDLRLGDALPNSRHTLTPPAPDKWRINEALIESVIDLVGEVDRNCRAALAAHRP